MPLSSPAASNGMLQSQWQEDMAKVLPSSATTFRLELLAPFLNVRIFNTYTLQCVQPGPMEADEANLRLAGSEGWVKRPDLQRLYSVLEFL